MADGEQEPRYFTIVIANDDIGKVEEYLCNKCHEHGKFVIRHDMETTATECQQHPFNHYHIVIGPSEARDVHDTSLMRQLKRNVQ